MFKYSKLPHHTAFRKIAKRRSEKITRTHTKAVKEEKKKSQKFRKVYEIRPIE